MKQVIACRIFASTGNGKVSMREHTSRTESEGEILEKVDRMTAVLEFLATLDPADVISVNVLPPRAEQTGSTSVWYRKPTGEHEPARTPAGKVCKGSIINGRAKGFRAILLERPGPDAGMCWVELLGQNEVPDEDRELQCRDEILIYRVDFDPDHTTEV
jgi:hypothetical protein